MKKTNNNPVTHPSHYTSGKIEVIDFITDQDLDFCLGNVIKYISRAGKKTEEGKTLFEKGLEDLKKAQFYLNYEIKILEKLSEPEKTSFGQNETILPS